MALKATLLCLLASFLLVTLSVTSIEAHKEPPHHPPVEAPHHAPEKAPVHPPVKAPVHAPVTAPPPHHAVPPMAHAPTHYGCVPLCEERCKEHRKKRPCMKVCTSCCKKCGYCVPPGTSGNEDKCEKWTEVTIHEQIFKCP